MSILRVGALVPSFTGLIGSNMIKANQNVYKCLQYHDHLVIILIYHMHSYAARNVLEASWKAVDLWGCFMRSLRRSGFDACESDASSWHLKQHVRAWTASTAFEGSHVWSRLVLVSGNVWKCQQGLGRSSIKGHWSAISSGWVSGWSLCNSSARKSSREDTWMEHLNANLIFSPNRYYCTVYICVLYLRILLHILEICLFLYPCYWFQLTSQKILIKKRMQRKCLTLFHRHQCHRTSHQHHPKQYVNIQMTINGLYNATKLIQMWTNSSRTDRCCLFHPVLMIVVFGRGQIVHLPKHCALNKWYLPRLPPSKVQVPLQTPERPAQEPWGATSANMKMAFRGIMVGSQLP